MTAATTTPKAVSVDADGNTCVDTPFGRATYLEYDRDGERFEGWPAVQFGDDLGSEADVRATIEALTAFLDDIDPGRVNRRSGTVEPDGRAIVAEVNRQCELRARGIAVACLRCWPEMPADGLDSVPSAPPRDPAAWSRAREILSDPIVGAEPAATLGGAA